MGAILKWDIDNKVTHVGGMLPFSKSIMQFEWIEVPANGVELVVNLNGNKKLM